MLLLACYSCCLVMLMLLQLLLLLLTVLLLLLQLLLLPLGAAAADAALVAATVAATADAAAAAATSTCCCCCCGCLCRWTEIATISGNTHIMFLSLSFSLSLFLYPTMCVSTADELGRPYRNDCLVRRSRTELPSSRFRPHTRSEQGSTPTASGCRVSGLVVERGGGSESAGRTDERTYRRGTRDAPPGAGLDAARDGNRRGADREESRGRARGRVRAETVGRRPERIDCRLIVMYCTVLCKCLLAPGRRLTGTRNGLVSAAAWWMLRPPSGRACPEGPSVADSVALLMDQPDDVGNPVFGTEFRPGRAAHR